MKTIVVTGGAGFIGSHLCRLLVHKGHRVICIDNLSTGRRANIADLAQLPHFRLIVRDVTLPIRLRSRIDEIYHLACPASPRHYQRDPLKTIDTCVVGTRNALDLAVRKNARILFASTSEVYGDPERHPQKETYWGNVNPVGLRSCYDEGKRIAETLCVEYARTKKTEIRIVRIFNTYGPSMDPDDGRVVSTFITQALRQQPLTLYGTGRQTRSFQYIDDLLDGMMRMMANTKKFFGPVNLGNVEEFTVRALARQVLALIPESRSRIVLRPLPSDDPRLRKPDIALARKMLGWKPAIPLSEGLQKTIAYFRLRLSQEA